MLVKNALLRKRSPLRLICSPGWRGADFSLLHRD